MINLVSCPLCTHANYLEAGALAVHILLTHVTQPAVPLPPRSGQTDDHA